MTLTFLTCCPVVPIKLTKEVTELSVGYKDRRLFNDLTIGLNFSNSHQLGMDLAPSGI